MIFTCEKCTRQHEWPAGWPAGAVFGCWDCGTMYVADAIDKAKPATEAQLAAFTDTGALAMQRVILAHCRTRFLGREGMIPWQEYQDVAKHGAKVHGYETHDIDWASDDDATVDEIAKILEGECLHCSVLRLVQFRMKHGVKTGPAEDIPNLVKAAAELSAASLKDGAEFREKGVGALQRLLDVYFERAFNRIDGARTSARPATAPCVPS